MVDLDPDAYLDANKGLTVCFIITIIIANCILIYKKIRQGQFLYTPRSLIMISLAIGDIFLAIFALVVLARVLFELSSYTSKLNCSTFKAYSSYLSFLIHFVYGLGLVVLAAEFVQRNRNPQPAGNNSNSIIKSLVYSACPWIIGLIIILPLTMADAYNEVYGGCRVNVTNSRVHAMYVVSVILPAILAVLVCIAVMFIKLSPPSPATVSYQGPTQGVVINSHDTSIINAAGPPQYPGSNAAAAPFYPLTGTQGSQQHPNNGIPVTTLVPTTPTNDKSGHNNGGQIFSTPSAQYPVQQYQMQQNPVQQYPWQQYPVQQYPAQQYPAQQYPTPQYAVQYPPPPYSVQQYITPSNIVYAAPNSTVYQHNTTAPTDPVKDKNALLITAIVYFICVVPLASYRISMLPLRQSYEAYTITDNVLLWLSIFRSLITPIIFIIVN